MRSPRYSPPILLQSSRAYVKSRAKSLARRTGRGIASSGLLGGMKAHFICLYPLGKSSVKTRCSHQLACSGSVGLGGSARLRPLNFFWQASMPSVAQVWAASAAV